MEYKFKEGEEVVFVAERAPEGIHDKNPSVYPIDSARGIIKRCHEPQNIDYELSMSYDERNQPNYLVEWEPGSLTSSQDDDVYRRRWWVYESWLMSKEEYEGSPFKRINDATDEEKKSIEVEDNVIIDLLGFTSPQSK